MQSTPARSENGDNTQPVGVLILSVLLKIIRNASFAKTTCLDGKSVCGAHCSEAGQESDAAREGSSTKEAGNAGNFAPNKLSSSSQICSKV